MRLYNDALLHSASDLNAFLGCSHAAALNLQKVRDPASLPERAVDDETAVLIQDAGHSHEARYLQQLREDPLHPDGLEYLWGVHYRDDRGEPAFIFAWGHNREAERMAFEGMVDFFNEHLARYPDAHIYHYAPYEVTVLRRLSTAFASREAAVDQLLRSEKLVDLFSVVRGAIRTSEPGGSAWAL